MMDFVFFDIECCDGNHMFSFGYVITDDKFNILDKKDIIMNPDAKFKLGRAGFNPAIELAYSEEEFKKQPLFPEFYTTIKKLIISPDRIILGHSVSSDIKYLLTACQRYKKEPYEIIAYDTQKIFEWFKGEDRQYSLKGIINDLSIDISNIKQHKSDDDALLSMFVAKEISNIQHIKLIDLLRRCHICKVESNDILNHSFQDKFAYSSDDYDKSHGKNLTAIEQAFQKAKANK